ncbi:hypothetical protein [Megasphaera elsdenii]|uniref:hypothetical protein n=1 Tax=Megasphaera elsdenii TaxID=907 RepID=UPI000690D20A|nr:hypothetical protein [Megasphaera elsdenii]
MEETMGKNLTNSIIDRQNILNNVIAVKSMEKQLNLHGTNWKNTMWFTKEYVARLYEVDIRTIENQVSKNLEEITNNGYKVLNSAELDEFKKFAPEMHFGRKIRNLGLFSFKAVLNMAMLLRNSEKAKCIRTQMLDIVLNVLTEKTGGHRLYINQRDPSFLDASYENYRSRKAFTQALNESVDMGIYKYEYFTNEIYKAIFLENAKRYQKILRLKSRSNLRDTMYSEVLTNIAAVESGIAYDINQKAKELGRKLKKEEVDVLIHNLTQHPSMKIYIEQARSKMASRDLCFRDAYHAELQDYISSVDSEDFEKFLGEKSKSLNQQIQDHLDIFKRLKDK